MRMVSRVPVHFCETRRAAETRAGLAPMVRMDIEECEFAVAAPRASSRRVVCASNSRNFFLPSLSFFRT